jgi:hypothetical protein
METLARSILMAPIPVDPDGHGTMTWLSRQGAAKQIDFYIVNGGAELKWILTDPPGTALLSVSGTMTKQ